MSSPNLLNSISAAEEAEKSNLKLPDPAPDGRINTLNSMGGSYKKLPEFTENFISLVKQYTKPKILEIGCAYGEACVNLMKEAEVDYTAIDIDPRHLKILARRIKDECSERLENLRLIAGNFPNEDMVELLKEESFDFILTENVLHFFTTKDLYETFHQFSRLLKPEGRLFSAISTPYLGIVKKDVIICFEHQVENFLRTTSTKEPDLEIPMFIEDYRGILDTNILTEEQMDTMLLPRGHSFLFDSRIARYFLERENFIVERCDYKSIERDPIKLDGRERLEIIARKPKEISIPII
uniref:Methyltransferase type 12 domain-containing protein n=1 Tax=Acrobeloides nanus TaxID=290746 RepID=A0A914C0P3_9BILA